MATTYPYDPLGGYNTNPVTQPGSGAYGAVPGAIGIPPNIYQQIGEINPDLANQTGTMNQTILSELQGELSPATLGQLQQHSAQFGVKSGMPGSQFAANQGFDLYKDSVEKRQRQGIEDYLSMLRGVGATLTPQQLAAEIASRNATMRAAPDPAAAAAQQMADWQNRFAQTAAAGTASPAGGTGGGGYSISPGRGGSGISPNPITRSTYNNDAAIAAATRAAQEEEARSRAWQAQQLANAQANGLPASAFRSGGTGSFYAGANNEAPYDPNSFYDPWYGTPYANDTVLQSNFNPWTSPTGGMYPGLTDWSNYTDPMASLLDNWMPADTSINPTTGNYYNNFGFDTSNAWNNAANDFSNSYYDWNSYAPDTSYNWGSTAQEGLDWLWGDY